MNELPNLIECAAMRALVVGSVLLLVACGGGEAPATEGAASSRTATPMQATQPLVSQSLVAGPLSVVGQGGSRFRVITAKLADGGYTVIRSTCASSDPLPTLCDLLALRFDATGTAAQAPAVIPLAHEYPTRYDAGWGVLLDGSLIVGYVVANSYWTAGSLFTQRYESTGAPRGTPVEVAYTARAPGDPLHVYFGFFGAPLSWADGGYLVSWGETMLGGTQIRTRRFDQFGAPVGEARSIGPLQTDTSIPQLLGLTALDDGGYLAAYRLSKSPSPARIAFVPYESTERTVTITADSATWWTQPSLVPLALGGYLLMSTKQSGPYAQVLDDAGLVIGEPSVQGGTAYALADGGFAVVSGDTAAAPGTERLLVQRFDGLGTPLGTPTRAGSPGADPALITGAGLIDGGLALTFVDSASSTGKTTLYTQVLREPDVSRQQQVKRCSADAKELVGVQHRQYMRRCLRGGV